MNNNKHIINVAIYLIIGLIVVICLRLWQLQLLEGDKYRKLSEDNRLRILKTPAARGIIFDRNGMPLVKNIPFFSASIVFDSRDYPDLDALSALLNVDKQELEQKLKKHNSPFKPVKLKQGLNFKEIAVIESRKSDFPGIFIETDISREYLTGRVASHITGYLGKINPSQLDDPELRHLPQDAFVGQWGAEMLFDKYLRGISGQRIIEVDALGRELKIVQENSPIRGQDLKMSIDIDIQKVAEEAFGDKNGALVAIKPNSGEVLALVSLPSFDPNIFSRGISAKDWNSIMIDKKKPMLNRAVQSQYPPGSVFKLITAIAALEEGVIDPNTKINCTGALHYGRWSFGCWKKGGHGAVDMHKAIVESCDVYFYEIGKRLGIDRIYKYATLFGLGSETGIELKPVREKKGLIPSIQWKKERFNQPWYLGDTFISAIGQGFVTTTPIQVAMMTAAFVNGGFVYKPSLVQVNSEPLRKINLKPETIRIVREAFSGVVNEPNGTAYQSSSSIVKFAGKTGTAQVVRKGSKITGERGMDHAWFVAYAPDDNPEIVVSVFVEHGGSGGAIAAPIAKKVIEAYILKKKS